MITPVVSLADYLVMSGMGVADAVGFSIAANTQVTEADNPIRPHQGDGAVLIDEIQFDGILSGQVVFDFFVEGSEFPGYAVPAIPLEMNILSRRAVKYAISNVSTQIAVVNIRFVSMSNDQYRNLTTALDQFGGQFGLNPRKVM